MNLDDYEVLVRKEVVIVLPSNPKKCKKMGNEMPLSLAVTNIRNKPFMTYGLPKDVKKYVEKNAAKVLPKIKKTKYPKVRALVQSPVSGNIIDITDNKQKTEEWFFSSAIYVMTLEEAKEYCKYFNSGFFAMEPEEKIMLESLGITNY